MVHSDSVQFVNFQQSVLDLISLYLVHGSQLIYFVSLQQSVLDLTVLIANLTAIYFRLIVFSSLFTVVLFVSLKQTVIDFFTL